MADPFASPKRRLTRAKQHFETLELGIDDFIKNNHCIAVVEEDADSMREFHKIRLAKAPSDTLIDSTVEAVEALRAALDQAAYACCHAVHGAKRSGTHFPIGDTADDVDVALVKGQSKYVPLDIAALFRSFQPYKGGNNSIWALNRLCNQGKHRLLVPVVSAVGAVRMTGTSMAGLRIPARPLWDREKNEITVLICDAGTEPQYDLDMSIYIAFNEIEELEGQPADGILRLMIREVERVVRATEAEASRIGLF